MIWLIKETAGFIGCCFAALVFAYSVAGMIA